jgi:hypothetical protein
MRGSISKAWPIQYPRIAQIAAAPAAINILRRSYRDFWIGSPIFSAGAGGNAGLAPVRCASASGRAGSGAGVVGRLSVEGSAGFGIGIRVSEVWANASPEKQQIIAAQAMNASGDCLLIMSHFE